MDEGEFSSPRGAGSEREGEGQGAGTSPCSCGRSTWGACRAARMAGECDDEEWLEQEQRRSLVVFVEGRATWSGEACECGERSREDCGYEVQGRGMCRGGLVTAEFREPRGGLTAPEGEVEAEKEGGWGGFRPGGRGRRTLLPDREGRIGHYDGTEYGRVKWGGMPQGCRWVRPRFLEDGWPSTE